MANPNVHIISCNLSIINVISIFSSWGTCEHIWKILEYCETCTWIIILQRYIFETIYYNMNNITSISFIPRQQYYFQNNNNSNMYSNTLFSFWWSYSIARYWIYNGSKYVYINVIYMYIYYIYIL